ncbi:hypothetical protein Tsp_03393 [Trichinella spiralis]|uniref:hypothetical protein n=1 Tax=Trichinella spiralis TaxID=6334 RepID=UPI0001EFCDAC|nr:hypothetical protein Tsp_03393 [Trichinella spiralis]
MLLALPANSVNFEMDKVHPIIVFDNFPSVEIESFPELDLPDLQAILRASPSCHIEDSHWNRMVDNIELVESCSLRMEQKDKIIEMLSLADDALVRKVLHNKPEEIEDDESPLSKILYCIVEYKFSSSIMCDELKTLNAEQTLVISDF